MSMIAQALAYVKQEERKHNIMAYRLNDSGVRRTRKMHKTEAAACRKIIYCAR